MQCYLDGCMNIVSLQVFLQASPLHNRSASQNKLIRNMR